MRNLPHSVLLIGSEGFLGKTLKKLLEFHGYDVIGIDIKASDDAGTYRRFIHKNIHDLTPEDLSFVASLGSYGLINAGGVSRSGIAAQNASQSSHDTITSYLKLLEMLDETPPEWMALTSTREVDLLLNGKEGLSGKRLIYPALKLGTELIAESFQSHWRIPVAIFRLSDLFGPGDHPSKAMQTFLRKAKSNEDIYVDAPELKLHLTEVNEVAERIYAEVCRMTLAPVPQTELIHVWDGDYALSLLELAYLACELNPQSRSVVVTPYPMSLEYGVLEKLTLPHRRVLEKINAALG
ncbi:MAG: NAD-dependent epimerase/dehydratase family protein [Sulfuricurvum sp.]|jgi:nucleoside-diphosphate-sugar epimerase|uniref:NAD-dependent epimerase/dehydratase family protein n=1 Tax=Sulfuricurvum sp. IAE1 TaxID=2546102 RepID=UPI001404C4BC|nr:NAD(P)-dependent oxidoreductase [Sulfuricurvum sp. IAE1]